jgi:hypothetical protein
VVGAPEAVNDATDFCDCDEEKAAGGFLRATQDFSVAGTMVRVVVETVARVGVSERGSGCVVSSRGSSMGPKMD